MELKPGDEKEMILASRLETASKEILESVYFGSQTWRVFKEKTYTTDFTSETTFPESELHSSSLDSHLHNMALFLEANPTYRMKVKSQASMIYAELKHPLAIIFATVIASGIAWGKTTICREAIVTLHWRLGEDGRWWIYKAVNMRGPGSAMGF